MLNDYKICNNCVVDKDGYAKTNMTVKSIVSLCSDMNLEERYRDVVEAAQLFMGEHTVLYLMTLEVFRGCSPCIDICARDQLKWYGLNCNGMHGKGFANVIKAIYNENFQSDSLNVDENISLDLNNQESKSRTVNVLVANVIGDDLLMNNPILWKRACSDNDNQSCDVCINCYSNDDFHYQQAVMHGNVEGFQLGSNPKMSLHSNFQVHSSHDRPQMITNQWIYENKNRICPSSHDSVRFFKF